MTKKEHLIDLLMEHNSECSRELVEKIFDIINKKDWKDFCSQMGDFDHPGERIQAKKDMELELEKLNLYKLPAIDNCVNLIKYDLTYFGGKVERFYSQNFHTLNEEYKES